MSTIPRPASRAKKKILLVEDEGQVGVVLDMILQEGNFELDYVSTLESADEYLQKEEPAVLILDNRLPDGFGVDFIPYIKKRHPSLKIIMISGLGAARDVAIENGADMFFEKPFHLEEFYEAISKLVK
jgi:two-component system OmpR family response regulator